MSDETTDLEAMADRIEAMLPELEALAELRREKRRARRVLKGLPADPKPLSVDEIRALTAQMRADIDAIEAERAWEA